MTISRSPLLTEWLGYASQLPTYVNIPIIAETPLTVHDRRTGQAVAMTNSRLEPGGYDVSCDSPIQVTNEPWVQRIITQ